MERINYKEVIELDEEIKDLLNINIDDNLQKIEQDDCLNLKGDITISGKVNTIIKEENFNHVINVDIMLSKEQLINGDATLTVDDFNYTIEKNKINLDLYLKLLGIKEMEAYFPSQEDQENLSLEEEVSSSEKENLSSSPLEASNDTIIETQDNNHPSLLKQIFANRNVKKKSSYLLHVAKEETTYSEIASIYNVEVSELEKLNKDKEIYPGKLIFISKNERDTF